MQKALEYLWVNNNHLKWASADMTNDIDSDYQSMWKTSAICEMFNVILRI